MGHKARPTVQLTVSTTKPFRSSFLAIPPSPFSPRLPLTPPATPPRNATATRPNLDLPCPPAEPLNWLWQCHICSRVYRLATTRRCLDDGHLFCAGTTTVRRSKRSGKKTLRHRACASEFDYAGWKAWGVWRRDAREQIAAAETLEEFLSFEWVGEALVPCVMRPAEGGRGKGRKDCWNRCDYPSECRWGGRDAA